MSNRSLSRHVGINGEHVSEYPYVMNIKMGTKATTNSASMYGISSTFPMIPRSRTMTRDCTALQNRECLPSQV